MEIKKEKYLPIGSIVTLKDSRLKFMIIGYCKNIRIDKYKENDYTACIYPLGIVNLKETLAFKHEQIKDIYYLGYNDKLTKKLNKILNEKSKENGVN